MTFTSDNQTVNYYKKLRQIDRTSEKMLWFLAGMLFAGFLYWIPVKLGIISIIYN